MHILIISQIFPPDMGGSATRAYNLAKGLRANGVDVTVLTGVPHYPMGDVPKGYRWKAFVRERIDGFAVIRTFVPPLISIGFARRLLLFASFIVSSLFPLLLVGRVDGVFASYPHILSFFPASVYGLFYECTVVLNVDDLWPESLYDLGMLKLKFLRSVAEFVDKVAYSAADAITPISPSYVKTIVEKYGVDKGKVVVVPGGVDLSYYNDVSRSECSGIFKVLYIGSFSPAYNFEQVLMAAKLLEEDSEVRLVLQGSGEMAPFIRRRIEELKLGNIELVERIVSRDEVAKLLMNANALLLPLSNLEHIEMGISSKLYEYQAAGKPIICCSRGMHGKYVKETGSGIIVEPGDYKGLAKAVLFLKQNNDVAADFGASGRKYVENNVSIESIGLVMKGLYSSIQ